MDEQPNAETIQDVIERLNNCFPEAKFSFGYLFNHPCPVEQQQWYVFTQVPTKTDEWAHLPNMLMRRHRYAFVVGVDMIEIYAESQGQHFFDWLMRLVDDYHKPRHLAWIEMCANHE